MGWSLGEALHQKPLAGRWRISCVIGRMNATLRIVVIAPDLSIDEWHRVVAINLNAVFYACRAAIPHMRKRGAGWIVVLGSVTAQPPGRPYDEWATYGGATVYAAIKAAVHRMTQGLAAELLQDNLSARRVVELEGPRRVAPIDVASSFAQILGHPVRVEAVPRESWESLFRSQGMKNPEPPCRCSMASMEAGSTSRAARLAPSRANPS